MDSHFQKVYAKKQKQMMNYQMNQRRWECLYQFVFIIVVYMNSLLQLVVEEVQSGNIIIHDYII